MQCNAMQCNACMHVCMYVHMYIYIVIYMHTNIEIYVFFVAYYVLCVYVPARSIKEVGVDVVIAGMGAQGSHQAT